MPLYPTAGRDDGYDITDFFGVDPRLGTSGDFVELVRTARSAGIRVVVDFVMNHTSDQHPWFKQRPPQRRRPLPPLLRLVAPPSRGRARPRSSSPTRRTASGSATRRPASTTCTTSTRPSPTSTSPTPQVQEQIASTLGYWLALGVSGFRIDAVPFLFANDTYPGSEPNGFNPQAYLKDVRDFVTRRLGDAALLGEVNLPYPQQKEFFGGADGDGLNMQFDFIGMQRLYLSLAREDAGPRRLRAARAPGARRHEPVGQLRAQPRRAHPRQAEHDRAQGGLRRLRPRPRHAALRPRPAPPAPDDARRRPAPHPARLLPDVLAARHPDALLRRGDRHGREPRRRGPARRAHPDAVGRRPQRRLLHARPKRRLTRPQPSGLFGPEHVNAAAQRQDPDSLWSFMRQLIRRYRQMPQIGWSDVEVLDHDVPAVLAHVCRATTGGCSRCTTSGPTTPS